MKQEYSPSYWGMEDNDAEGDERGEGIEEVQSAV